jgi:hypothetical protein
MDGPLEWRPVNEGLENLQGLTIAMRSRASSPSLFDYNGKHEISRQTRSPDIETIAAQSQRRDGSANDAEDSALRANAGSGASPRANLSYR